MEAFTSYAGRRTRVMGAMGDMVGDMEELGGHRFSKPTNKPNWYPKPKMWTIIRTAAMVAATGTWQP